MIRDINENDYELISKYAREIFDSNISFNEEFNYKKVYVLNNRIIGFIDYSVLYERAEINYIYVLEPYQRQGIASKLIDNMLSSLKDVINITLEVNENNIKAINFYKKNGFEIVSKRANYYKDGTDAYLMMKVI